MVLIPKKPDANTVDAFRPICLQNGCIKILSKILTTRLQLQIKNLIDLDQTGFIRGRSNTENFVYAMELVECCHKRKVPTLVIKLDFAKAFHTVSWAALDTVLQSRGFNTVWRRWMRDILQSSRSAVLVNGSPGARAVDGLQARAMSRRPTLAIPIHTGGGCVAGPHQKIGHH